MPCFDDGAKAGNLLHKSVTWHLKSTDKFIITLGMEENSFTLKTNIRRRIYWRFPLIRKRHKIIFHLNLITFRAIIDKAFTTSYYPLEWLNLDFWATKKQEKYSNNDFLVTWKGLKAQLKKISKNFNFWPVNRDGKNILLFINHELVVKVSTRTIWKQ